MNNIFRIFKQNLRIIYQFSHIPKIQLNVVRLCNLNKLNQFNTSKNALKLKLIINSSILTWLGFAKEDQEKESELIMTIKRAILLTQRGEYLKAERMLHIALKISQDQQNSQGVLYIYDLMANLALEKGELDKSETLFVNVLQRLLNDGIEQDDLKVIHISLKLARIYQMKGDIEKAKIGYQWCLDSVKKKENDDDVVALNGIIQDWYAQFLIENNQINESLRHLEEAYKICCDVQGYNSEKSVLLLNDLGTANWKLGELGKAEKYLNKAVQLGKNIDDFDYLGVIYSNLGLVYLQNGILNEAKKFCKEGWRLGKKQKNSDAIEQANYCFEQIKIQS